VREDLPLQSFRLAATIRQVPGINSTRRWQKGAQDRLYIVFSVSDPLSEVFVDMKCGVLFGTPGWREDPHELGERALQTVRALCEEYRRALPATVQG
jgi:hypothetical protein